MEAGSFPAPRAPKLLLGLPLGLLAALIGVNLGPNLTYVGSLATLLWRRILHAHGDAPELGHFTLDRARLLSSLRCARAMQRDPSGALPRVSARLRQPLAAPSRSPRAFRRARPT